MSAVLTIAGREMRERWSWLGVSLAVGLLSLLWPYGIIDRETLAAVVLVPFPILTLIATAVMGASVLAGDLLQGRLGFLLARPVSAWSIWGGKFLAALTLAGTSILALAPAMLQGPGDRVIEAFGGLTGVPIFVSCLIIGLCVSQGAVMAFRARSAWLLLDLVLLGIALYAGSRVLWALALSGGLDLGASQASIGMVFHGVALAAAAASAAPFLAGGVSVRRAHAFFSVTLWTVLFAVIGVGGMRAHWAARPAASDLEQIVAASADPQGRWIGVFSGVRGRAGARPMMFHTRGNADERPTLVAPASAAYPVFSANGRMAAWMEMIPRLDEMRVRVWVAHEGPGGRLERAVVPVPVPVTETALPALALSPRGDRLAVAAGSSLWIYEVPTPRLSRTIRLPMALKYAKAFYTADGRVLLYGQHSPQEARIIEARTGDGHAALTGEIKGTGMQIVADPATGNALAIQFGSPQAAIHAPITGREEATLSPEPIFGWRHAVLTGPRHAAVAFTDGPNARVQQVGTDGSRREAAMGPARAVALDADASRRRLYLGVKRLDDTTELLVLDADTLALVRTEKGLWPIHHADTLARTDSDSRLFRDADQTHLIRFDFETGRREVVLGRKG